MLLLRYEVISKLWKSGLFINYTDNLGLILIIIFIILTLWRYRFGLFLKVSKLGVFLLKLSSHLWKPLFHVNLIFKILSSFDNRLSSSLRQILHKLVQLQYSLLILKVLLLKSRLPELKFRHLLFHQIQVILILNDLDLKLSHLLLLILSHLLLLLHEALPSYTLSDINQFKLQLLSLIHAFLDPGVQVDLLVIFKRILKFNLEWRHRIKILLLLFC